MKYTVYQLSDGRVLFSGTASNPDTLAQVGQVVVPDVQYTDGWMDGNGGHHEKPAPPGPHHAFDWAARQWIDPRTLPELQAAKWREIKQQRDTLEATSFPYLGKQIDSDPRSVQRITTAAQAADAAQRAGAAFAIEWTCADNSTLALDGAAMQGMPVALAVYANILHQHARSLRALVEAAPGPDALDLITWETHA